MKSCRDFSPGDRAEVAVARQRRGFVRAALLDAAAAADEEVVEEEHMLVFPACMGEASFRGLLPRLAMIWLLQQPLLLLFHATKLLSCRPACQNFSHRLVTGRPPLQLRHQFWNAARCWSAMLRQGQAVKSGSLLFHQHLGMLGQ